MYRTHRTLGWGAVADLVTLCIVEVPRRACTSRLDRIAYWKEAVGKPVMLEDIAEQALSWE